MQIQGTVVDS